MPYIYRLDGAETPDVSLIGDKALGLMRLMRAQLPTPPGFVLTTDFFAPWAAYIEASTHWEQAKEAVASGTDVAGCAENLMHLCQLLQLDGERQKALGDIVGNMGIDLAAIRSSVPLPGTMAGKANFAGLYATVLAAPADKIAEGLRLCFASAFSQRVLAYYQRQHIPLGAPGLAIVVQHQILADASGVVYTANPNHNNRDELVVNANFGLGASAVTGRSTPDRFVLARADRRLIDQKPGAKERAYWARLQGGIFELPNPHPPGIFAITTVQAQALAALAAEAEAAVGGPVEVEWALEDGALSLLQVRPMTSYFALPDALNTGSDEPVLYYLDETPSRYGVAGPVSVLGEHCLQLYQSHLSALTSGRDITGAKDGIGGMAGGFSFLNVSHQMRLYGRQSTLRNLSGVDGAAGRALAVLDENDLPETLPPKLQGIAWEMVSEHLDKVSHMFAAKRRPEQNSEQFEYLSYGALEEMESDAAGITGLAALAAQLFDRVGQVRVAARAIEGAALSARRAIEKLLYGLPEPIRALAPLLEEGLPHNITVEMATAFAALVKEGAALSCASAADFAAKLEAGVLPEDFMAAWHQWMRLYGFRGPGEMDIASPRYSELTAALYAAMRSIHTPSLAGGTSRDLEAQHQETVARREDAYRQIGQFLRAHAGTHVDLGDRFETQYHALVLLGGYREMPLHCMAKALSLLRERALAAGRRLARAGRLAAAEDVFGFTLHQLDDALEDPDLNLAACQQENIAARQAFLQMPASRLIDSRGRVQPPARLAGRKEQICGIAAAPGVGGGPVKHLAFPGEKAVCPGDVIVAASIDPGWIHLLPCVAGVIVDAGGPLQHGVAVLRELGIPCVCGVDMAAEVLGEGQFVEIDGTAGTVTLL